MCIYTSVCIYGEREGPPVVSAVGQTTTGWCRGEDGGGPWGVCSPGSVRREGLGKWHLQANSGWKAVDH